MCLIVPGISGGQNQGYLKALGKTLLTDGFELVVYNARGQGDAEYTSTQFADLTSTEEFERAMAFMRD